MHVAFVFSRTSTHTIDSTTVFTKPKKELNTIFTQSAEPKVTQEATERVVKILDSTYEKANLEEIVDNAHQLDATQKSQLLDLLVDFEDQFDGTLGHLSHELTLQRIQLHFSRFDFVTNVEILSFWQETTYI